MAKAIDIIRAEHRALAAVLAAMQAYLAGVADGRHRLDAGLLAAMVAYITEVPDRVHHPKEDGYLFPALRRRAPASTAVLHDLEEEHRTGHAQWSALAAALGTFEHAGMAGLAAFRDAVDRYLEFQWRHMATEERHVLPLARDALLPEDWAAIDAAFAANDSPWEGPAGKYRQLFARIVDIAPTPIGLADDDGAGDARH